MTESTDSDLLPSVNRLYQQALGSWHTGRTIRELRSAIKNTDPIVMAEIDERLLRLSDNSLDALIDQLNLPAIFPNAKP